MGRKEGRSIEAVVLLQQVDRENAQIRERWNVRLCFRRTM